MFWKLRTPGRAEFCSIWTWDAIDAVFMGRWPETKNEQGDANGIQKYVFLLLC